MDSRGVVQEWPEFGSCAVSKSPFSGDHPIRRPWSCQEFDCREYSILVLRKQRAALRRVKRNTLFNALSEGTTSESFAYSLLCKLEYSLQSNSLTVQMSQERHLTIQNLGLLQRQAGVDPEVAELVVAYGRLLVDAGQRLQFEAGPFPSGSHEHQVLCRLRESNPGIDCQVPQFPSQHGMARWSA